MYEKLEIRKAQLGDTNSIALLLAQMGYPQDLDLLGSKIERLIHDRNEVFLVAEIQANVCGFISMYYVPQLGVKGDFARISYFCVDENYRSRKIGKQLLELVEIYAKEHGCDRMELRSAEYRKDAHRFYLNNGYTESPKFFTKKFE